MTTGKMPSRGDSISPKTEGMTANGVVHSNTASGDSKQPVAGPSSSGGVAIPSWKGPQQDGGVTVDSDPFSMSSARLSGGGLTIKPDGVKPAPISFLNRDSEADEDKPVIVQSTTADEETDPTTDKGKGKAKGPQEPIGTRGAKAIPSRPRIYFTTDVGPDVISPGGHYVKIENVPSKEISQTLETFSNAFGWDKKTLGCAAPPSGSNFCTIYACFDDIRDASDARRDAQLYNTRVTATYISQTEYLAIHEGPHRGTTQPTTFHDGQLILTAHFQGLTSDMTVDGLFDAIKRLAARYGDVVGVVEMETDGGKFDFRVEYFSIGVARNVIKSLVATNPATIDKWIVSAHELPDYTVQIPKHGQVLNGTPHKIMKDNQMQYMSPTGRSAWRIDENGKQVAVRAPRALPKCNAGPPTMRGTPKIFRGSDPLPATPANYWNIQQDPRSASWDGLSLMTPSSSGRDATHGPQVVDLDRIFKGQDVRTTAMLRNLPNDIQVGEFKRIIDTISRHKYDFSYLRMEFEKGTNVGYAFVNFLTPEDLAEFVDFWRGNPWCPSRPFSPKSAPRIAEISYATIQGVDCAKEKFRNSSVMDEYADYRPKLWWTAQTAPDPSMIGTERPFPPPNNVAKHQRSRDNATQIGLYVSNRGRGQGNGHRYPNQRRSQYDRGTPSQIQEEAAYHQQQISPAGYTHNGQLPMGPHAVQMQMPMAPPPTFNLPWYGYMNGGHVVDPNFGHGGWYGGGYGGDPFNGGYAHEGQAVAPPRQPAAQGYNNNNNHHNGFVPFGLINYPGQY